jgi:hypothetical protein
MIKRLVVGLIVGFAVGALVAAAVVAGLGWLTFAAGALGAVGAYVLALATGAITGLVAGKPVWARGGAIEAGLKSFFGALLAAGGMFALRTWVHADVDLAMVHGGQGVIGDLPAAALPLIAAVLGGFFELDNTPEGKEGKDGKDAKAAGAKTRVAPNVRVAAGAEADEDEGESASPAAKKRTR